MKNLLQKEFKESQTSKKAFCLRKVRRKGKKSSFYKIKNSIPKLGEKIASLPKEKNLKNRKNLSLAKKCPRNFA